MVFNIKNTLIVLKKPVLKVRYRVCKSEFFYLYYQKQTRKGLNIDNNPQYKLKKPPPRIILNAARPLFNYNNN